MRLVGLGRGGRMRRGRRGRLLLLWSGAVGALGSKFCILMMARMKMPVKEKEPLRRDWTAFELRLA